MSGGRGGQRGGGRARSNLPKAERERRPTDRSAKGRAKAVGGPSRRARESGQGTHGLARVISKLGFCSRSEAERLVAAGRVTVDGRVERDPERRTDPGREAIAVDGKRVERREPVYLLMHKPAGLITTASDEKGRPTVYSLLPEIDRWVAPVGRLDADTTGALLFTNDTRVGEALAGDRWHVEKTYEAVVAGDPGADALAALGAGVEILVEGARYRTLPAAVRYLGPDPGGARISLTIREGKNRQVRRMLEAVGHPVRALHRSRIGPIDLGDLPLGATRVLTASEVRSLHRLIAGGPPPVLP
jgi:23S rRNA pseudouridine2605 synthase